ncbi:MAG TPA: TRAP transporter fused permease subunit [Microvirga sp.]|jgi:TRAP transporter 4TM/12TM fusion protein|nr:TRAP transporter fused permease subunit [Microvirga sp.]
MSPSLRLIAPGRSRTLGTPERWLLDGLAVLTALMLLAIAFGVYVERTVALFGFLGAVLAIAFVTTTGNPDRPRTRSPWSWALAAASLAACAYFIVMQPVHEMRLPMIDELTPADIVAGIAICALVLEATRRCIGFTLVALVLIFLAYGIFGHALGGSFSHRSLSTQEILDHLVFSRNGLQGPPLEVAAFLVFVFVLFGALLDRWGGGDFFHDLASAVVGRQVGGPGKVAVVSSGLYGSISGSPTADVVTTGSFTIPLMIRTGLKPAYAGAVEAAASTGGAILPPVMGTAAFLMVDFTGISYGTIVLASLVPALLYYLAVFLSVHLRAHADGLKPMRETGAPTLVAVLRRDWLFFVPIAALVWGVLHLDRPAYAGAIACLTLLPIALQRDRDPRRIAATLVMGLREGMLRIIGVGVACAVAGLVVGTLSMTDLTGKISSGMFALAAGNHLLTLVTATVVIILLGMGMPTPAVYALSAVLAAPALLEMGIPLLPAHLFIVYFASMSAITPPVAVAAFAAASIADDNPIRVGLIACRVAFVAFLLPFIFIWNPALLLQGDVMSVALRITSAACAIVAFSAALERYLFGPLTGPWVLVTAALGVLLIVPQPWTDVAGLVLFAGLMAWRVRGRRVPLARRDAARESAQAP